MNLAFLVAVGALVGAPLGAEAVNAGVAAAATSAVLAGLIVSTTTRVSFEVSTPASSVAVIHASLALALASRPGSSFASVWASMSFAVVVMGMLMLVAARLRLADAVRFLPAPVSAGFVTGIGLLVIWSQLPALLGTHKALPFAPAGFQELRPGAVAVGSFAAVFLFAWQKRGVPGPGNLAAVLLATMLHHLLAAGGVAVGPTLDALRPATAQMATLGAVAQVSFASVAATLGTVLPYAGFLALQALMNAAVSTPAAAALSGEETDVNRIVRAQGLANILCGLLAALPVVTHTVLSMSATRQRARWQDVAASCMLLFAILFFVGGLLQYVPVAALAGTLVVSGFGLIDKWARRLAGTALATRGRDREVMMNLGLVTAVAASFMIGSVPLALLVGSVLAMVMLTVNLSRATRVSVQDAGQRSSTHAWTPQQAKWLSVERRRITIVLPRGGLFFGTAEHLSRALACVAATQTHCIVDMGKLTTLDASGCQLLAAGARRLARNGTRTLLAGVAPGSPQGAAMLALGLDEPPTSQWLPDVDHALERAERELLRIAGPTDSVDDALTQTALARGLSGTETAELRAVMVLREAQAGLLFAKSETARSMYVVESGCVEIRVHNVDAGRTTRLASFGPGSIFGEIALLSTGVRTADAWCTEASRLYELTREAFDQLELRNPRLHAQVLRNLGMHLAERLVIATSTMEAQQ